MQKTIKQSVLLLYCYIAVLLIVLPGNVEAAKVLPRYQKKAAAQPSANALNVSVKLPYDKKAVNVNLKNSSALASFAYTLNYFTNGREEGAVGLVSPLTGDTFYKELLFGTCSQGVCTYHSNLANVKLTLTFSFKSGKQITKKYRIKV